MTFSRGHDPIIDLVAVDRLLKPNHRLGAMLVADWESGMVHRNHALCPEVEKCLHGFFGVHMHFATARAIVGTDREKSRVDGVPCADLGKPIEIG